MWLFIIIVHLLCLAWCPARRANQIGQNTCQSKGPVACFVENAKATTRQMVCNNVSVIHLQVKSMLQYCMSCKISGTGVSASLHLWSTSMLQRMGDQREHCYMSHVSDMTDLSIKSLVHFPCALSIPR